MYAYDFPAEWKDRLFSTFYKQAHALFNLYQKPEKRYLSVLLNMKQILKLACSNNLR